MKLNTLLAICLLGIASVAQAADNWNIVPEGHGNVKPSAVITATGITDEQFQTLAKMNGFVFTIDRYQTFEQPAYQINKTPETDLVWFKGEKGAVGTMLWEPRTNLEGRVVNLRINVYGSDVSFEPSNPESWKVPNGFRYNKLYKTRILTNDGGLYVSIPSLGIENVFLGGGDYNQ